MVDPINNIARQAHQGSVSAIIQVLNETLADSGVRTRAIFVHGVLQLLCEAATLEQLEQHVLVDRVRQILESIQPRNIRRININSRLVREQQLLWLEEISRDPKNQLLWSQEIILARPNPLKQWLEDWKSQQSDSAKALLHQAASHSANREKRQFWRGIIGGASLSLLVLLVGWSLLDWIRSDWGSFTAQGTEEGSAVEQAAIAPSPTSLPPIMQSDPFVQAVQLAEQAAIDGQTAKTPADWLDLAARWQRASDLMITVPLGDARQKTAQDRAETYHQNSMAALTQAEKLRSQNLDFGQ
jgi:hypothetical protein